MTQLTTDSTTNINIVKELVTSQCFKGYPILQQLTIAQAILESGLQRSPPSMLALKYNNLFGIKAGGSVVPTGTNGVVPLTTTEYHDGYADHPVQPFLANLQVEDSLYQHEKLFRTLSRYSNLFGSKTFADAALQVKLDGYCTDPTYPVLLVQIYNRYLK